MTRIEVGPRLTYWTAPHPRWKPNPEWPEEVGCVLYYGDDALVLVDPLVRDDLDPDAWSWLDGAVARHGRAVVVALTAPWHLRSTRDAVERYGARVWLSPVGRARAGNLPWLDELPTGVETFAPGGRDEGQVAFWLPCERALVVAEFLVGRAGGLSVEASVSPAEGDVGAFAASLEALRELPIDHLLVAHGEPLIDDGAAAVGDALDRFRKSLLP